MSRLLIRFSVALIAFVVGIVTTGAFAALFGLGVARESGNPNYTPRVEKRLSCPSQRSVSELPEPPPPPAPRPAQQERVVIRNADGSVRVIESQSGVTVERR